jgi:hypothetical protein
MRGAIPPLPHTSSCRGGTNLRLHYLCLDCLYARRSGQGAKTGPHETTKRAIERINIINQRIVG